MGSLCMCLEWLATVASLTTSSASALALFYIAPLWAVPMGLVVNSERLHHRTIVAMLVAFAGAAARVASPPYSRLFLGRPGQASRRHIRVAARS